MAATFGIDLRQVGLGYAPHAQGAEEAVGVQRRGSEDLGQAPGPDAAVDLHLPKAVLGVDEAQGEGGVFRGRGINMRNAILVAHYIDRAFKPRNLDRSVELRQ